LLITATFSSDGPKARPMAGATPNTWKKFPVRNFARHSLDIPAGPQVQFGAVRAGKF
jgi:hypothetical protein